ncbi:SPOR domain-containing protein [Flavobacterium sp. MFBS3-15]|uniref:SPOR domain-containing protein n=1 Tax=Flavobacterium sp. MFBS3-15 TaxID=2989816 RepID=UPI0022364684|nr:SPOR domain-containing protein [Flavobacterium sp. MFBS3-15]MCW4469430.1 SPOR domain-containing protein [Flavobacterium sp. MFBS3-15]
MRILKTGTLILGTVSLFIATEKTYSQEGTVTVVQDSKFEQLLAEKRRMNASITVNEKYKIQIFYGDNNKARKTLSDFKKEFKTLDGTIVFESPTYKVWVGNFKTRFEAEKSLAVIRKKYPYALLIKPNK